MPDDEAQDFKKRHRVWASKPGGEGIRGTSGDFHSGGVRHQEYGEKKLLEREETLSPSHHTSSPQAGGMFKTEGPGSTMDRRVAASSGAGDLAVDERISAHAVDASTKFSDRRRYEAGDSVHQDQRALAGHSRETERGSEKPEQEKRLESTRRTPPPPEG